METLLCVSPSPTPPIWYGYGWYDEKLWPVEQKYQYAWQEYDVWNIGVDRKARVRVELLL